MRLSLLTTTALTAATTFVSAQTDIAQPQQFETTSALTTWTLTRTVERVVQTVTATRNGTEISMTSTSAVMPTIGVASMSLTPYSNGTGAGWGASSGLGGAPAQQTGVPVHSGAGRGKLAMGAMAGLVGAVGLALL